MTRDLQMIVDQPSTGHFYWTIIDFGDRDEDPSVVDYARGPLPTRSSATVAGMTALVVHRRTNNLRSDQLLESRFGGNLKRAPGALVHACAP